MSGNLAASEALLRVPGVKPSLLDASQCTAMDWAAVNGHMDVWNGIRNKGGTHSDNWTQKISPAYCPWQSGYGCKDDEQDTNSGALMVKL